VRGFLGANLFLLGMVLTGALLSAGGAALLEAAGRLEGKALAAAWIAAGVAATVATGYVGATAHGAIARRVSR
jgi:hypothetical protein